MRTENDSAAPSPITSLLRRWPLAVVLTLLCGVLGFVVGGLLPSTTTAQARLAVGPGDMSAGAIAGFPEATRAMAEDYARWVTSAAAEQGGAAKVSASPVPESNVILVEASAADEGTAVQAAQGASQSLVTSVNQGRDSTDPKATLDLIKQTSTAWSAAKTELARATWEFDKVNQNASSTSAAYDRAAAALTKAQADEAYLKSQLDAHSEKYKQQIGDASQAADLRIIQNATATSNTSNSLRQRFAILGAALGLLLALVIATMSDRRRARGSAQQA